MYKIYMVIKTIQCPPNHLNHLNHYNHQRWSRVLLIWNTYFNKILQILWKHYIFQIEVKYKINILIIWLLLWIVLRVLNHLVNWRNLLDFQVNRVKILYLGQRVDKLVIYIVIWICYCLHYLLFKINH